MILIPEKSALCHPNDRRPRAFAPFIISSGPAKHYVQLCRPTWSLVYHSVNWAGGWHTYICHRTLTSRCRSLIFARPDCWADTARSQQTPLKLTLPECIVRYDCTESSSSSCIIIFSDDRTLVGRNKDQKGYKDYYYTYVNTKCEASFHLALLTWIQLSQSMGEFSWRGFCNAAWSTIFTKTEAF